MWRHFKKHSLANEQFNLKHVIQKPGEDGKPLNVCTSLCCLRSEEVGVGSDSLGGLHVYTQAFRWADENNIKFWLCTCHLTFFFFVRQIESEHTEKLRNSF